VVRLSGPEAEAIARRLFCPHRPRSRWQSHRLYLGHLLDAQGRVIDEVLLTLMRAPHSYTRQDVVEIQCHSGPQVLHDILAAVLQEGARLARPGEFTLRAFLSGRLSLPQAEAVLEVIQARSAAALRVAQGHLAGGLGRRLSRTREILLTWLAQVEAILDFPEEIEEMAPKELLPDLHRLVGDLAGLAATWREGRLLREGLRLVIAGRPNVGKSSLLNRLLQEDRVIVTDIPGTTRDVIEETVVWDGLPVRLTDTAGLRTGGDPVEELGMAKTRERLAAADLVLYLVDGSQPLEPADRETLGELAGRSGLTVITKADLPQRLTPAAVAEMSPFPVLWLSALTGQGVEDLKAQVVQAVRGGGMATQGEVLTQARHHRHLTAAVAHLEAGLANLKAGAAWELVAEDFRGAIHELGEITGEEAGDEVLERIFAQFCLGK
jgi:tRNA modification GTPase